jgi:hypothetical protein
MRRIGTSLGTWKSSTSETRTSQRLPLGGHQGHSLANSARPGQFVTHFPRLLALTFVVFVSGRWLKATRLLRCFWSVLETLNSEHDGRIWFLSFPGNGQSRGTQQTACLRFEVPDGKLIHARGRGPAIQHQSAMFNQPAMPVQLPEERSEKLRPQAEAKRKARHRDPLHRDSQ